MRKSRKESAPQRSPRTSAAGERRGQSTPPPKPTKPGAGRSASRIVDPGSEHGVPYPGDIPNPLAGKYRGCF